MSSYRAWFCLVAALAVTAGGGCATGAAGEDGGGLVDMADAPSGGRDDADPGAADAAPKPDAVPGTPDAQPPPPDAAPPPDAPPPDAPLPDATPGTPDAAPIPDAALPPDACVDMTINLLANPGFDSGAGVGWTETSSGGFPIVNAAAALPPGVPPQAGTHAAWLGGYDNAVDQLVQTVVIPSDATALRFKGFRWIATEELSGTFDFLRFEIRDGGGATLETLAQFSNADSTTNWTAFDLVAATPHAGQTVQVYLRGTTDISLNTNFFMDSLSFEVTVCR